MCTDFTKIFVVGGYNDNTGEYYDSAEVVDLTSEVQSCLPPANYPFPVYYMVGTLINDMPLICGGYDDHSASFTDACYQYNHSDNRWFPTQETMLHGRWGHQASMVDSETWLISGGQINVGDYDRYDSTEVYQNDIFDYGPVLPTPRAFHCQVTLNSTHIAVLGGRNETDDYLSDFYLLDWENQDWTPMPDLPFLISSDPCGLIENSANGQEMVVLAKHDDCQIFNFGDQTWRPGPILADGPHIKWESMVAQMTKNFYILGGRLEDEPGVTDVVFEFDAENYEWVRQSFTLSNLRRGGVAIPVPDDVVECL